MRASLLAKEPEKKEEAKPLGKEIPVDLNAGKQGFSKVAGMDNLKKLVGCPVNRSKFRLLF